MRPDQHASVEMVYEDLSWQVDHPRVKGLKLEPWQWHQLMMFAFAKEMGWDPILMPSFDGDGMVMLVRNRQSRLTKKQGSELIEFAKSWAVQHGAVLRVWDENNRLIEGREPPMRRAA